MYSKTRTCQFYKLQIEQTTYKVLISLLRRCSDVDLVTFWTEPGELFTPCSGLNAKLNHLVEMAI